MASIYDRTIYVNEAVLSEVDAQLLWNYSKIKVKINGEPAWFIENTDVNGYATFLEITAQLNGTYTYQVEVWNVAITSFIEFATLTVIAQETFNNITNCCSDENTNIVWFNRQGGWQNYIFTQRFDNSVEVGKATTFINNGIIKYADRGRVYNSKTVYVTGLTKTEIDYLDTLRYSIQAYEFNQALETFTPILLDSSNFNKYNSKENMYEFSLTYKYATQLDIQKQ
jgi:hypothetical protein